MPMSADLMAEAIITLMDAATTAQTGQPTELSDDAKDQRLASVKAMCQGIIAHVMANMTITITAAAAGLQTTTALGAPTGPPALPVPLLPGVGIIIT